MTTKARALAILTLAAPMLGAQAQTTQTATPAPPPTLSPAEQTIQDIKNPVSWMTWGGDMRVRDEYFDNILTLNPYANLHLQDYLRVRGRIWTSVRPLEGVSINARLADEAREWFRPAGFTPFKGRSGLDMREGIFDNLNVQWRNILQQPLSVTVGRQDIFLGDGWLTGDGTPQDGSWTYFLDSARLTYEFKEQHTAIEALGIIQDGRDDGWMPTINDQDLLLTEQNEKGAILWIANKSIPQLNVDGYFFYKHDDALNGISVPQFRPDNADIYTLGGRISGLLAEHWQYSVGGAFQFGQKQDPNLNGVDASHPNGNSGDNPLLAPSAQTTGFRDIRAYGGTAGLGYLFKDRLNNQLGLAFAYLSGDDPNTKDDEMFDNLWGRWPRWSEIGLYSFAAETRIGNEANLLRFGPTWSFTPVRNLQFSAAYYALFAPKDIATRATGGASGLFAGNAGLSDHGGFRGHFLQTVLKYRFNKHMMGHLWAEFEFPGDYYTYRQTWYFLRPEIMFVF